MHFSDCENELRRKRVLILGMLDSIHLARWLEQFQDADIEFLLFPSTHFKFPHRHLFTFRQSRIRVTGLSYFGRYLGYVDSLLTLRFVNNRLAFLLRGVYLRTAIRVFRPDVIHAIEIQHAGYLVSSIGAKARRKIITNWGSDIYYFQHKFDHRERIRISLQWATDYSAECERDYQLAQEFGFVGRNLPKIPNAGGFNHLYSQSKCSQRDLILVKSYGGEFGAGSTAIKSIRLFLAEHQDFNVFFYSVTNDLLDDIQDLIKQYPQLVNYSTLKNPKSQDDIMNLFGQARVYLGCSYSDGLSTSFLQAICSGAYPIQTNTSCAGELLLDGVVGAVIPLDIDKILSTLKDVTFDIELLDHAQKINAAYSRSNLSASKVSSIAKSFYLP